MKPSARRTYLGVGSGASPTAAPGATIPSKEPFDVTELMEQMGATIGKVNDTIQKVNDTIDEMKDDVQRAVVSGADTIDVAHKLLNDVSGDVKKMASDGARLSAYVVLTKPPLRRLAFQLVRIWLGATVPLYLAGEARQAWVESGRPA